MVRMVHCVKLSKEAKGLDFLSLPGEPGEKLWQDVLKEAWAGWLKYQIMLINENRLSMADSCVRQYLLKQTEKYLSSDSAGRAVGYISPSLA